MRGRQGQWLRALIRWGTGIALATVMIGGAGMVYPSGTASQPGAWVLAFVMAGLLGLAVALPPLQAEDDWVRIGLRRKPRIVEEKPPVEPIVIPPPVILQPPRRETRVRLPAQALHVPRIHFPSFHLGKHRHAHRRHARPRHMKAHR